LPSPAYFSHLCGSYSTVLMVKLVPLVLQMKNEIVWRTADGAGLGELVYYLERTFVFSFVCRLDLLKVH
jgi:hypothetical protein